MKKQLGRIVLVIMALLILSSCGIENTNKVESVCNEQDHYVYTEPNTYRVEGVFNAQGHYIYIAETNEVILESHIFKKVVVIEPTYSEIGFSYDECTYCGYVVNHYGKKLAHSHEYVSGYNDIDHYNVCECGATIDRQCHTFLIDNTTESVKCHAQSVKCITCGYNKTFKTEECDKCSYADKFIDFSGNGDICTECGYLRYTEKHTSKPTLIKRAFLGEDGIINCKCDKCKLDMNFSYSTTDRFITSVEPHKVGCLSIYNFGQEQKFSDHRYQSKVTNDGSVEKVCSYCKYIEGSFTNEQDFTYDYYQAGHRLKYSDHSSAFKTHTFGYWNDELADGVSYRECLVCGYKEYKPIHTDLEHIFSYKHDNELCWQECSCGKMKDIKSHQKTQENILEEPTTNKCGLAESSCSLCGAEFKYELPKLAHVHSYGYELYKDEYSHYNLCECGERGNVINHSYGSGKFCEICDYRNGISFCSFRMVDDGYSVKVSNLNYVRIPSTYNNRPVVEIEGVGKEVVGIYIPTTVKRIANRAFYDCSNLTRIDGGQNVESIGDRAFEYCSKLKIFNSKSIKSIGDYAFYGCSSLENLNQGFENIEHLGEDAFGGCDSLKYYEYGGGLYIDEGCRILAGYNKAYCMRNKFYLTSNTKYIYKDAIFDLEMDTFDTKNLVELNISYLPRKLKNLVIGKNLKSVIVASQVDVYNLLTITIDENNSYFYGNNTLVSRETNKLLLGSYNGVIQDTVTEIGRYAFAYLPIKNIDIPASVKIIGEYAFKSTALQNVNFNEGLEEIRDGAFEYTNITNVTLPDSIKSLNGECFEVKASSFIEDGISYISTKSNKYYYASYFISAENVSFNPNTKVILLKANYRNSVKNVYILGECTIHMEFSQNSIENIYILEKNVKIKEYNKNIIFNIFYYGTEEEFKEITDVKLNSVIYYYSLEEPTSEGNYWYYDSNNNVVIWTKEN